MPRRSVEQVRATREAVLSRSADAASVLGLDGLTFGQIAAKVELSKSGLAGHFESKTAWQLAVVGHARTVFTDTVIRPGRDGADAHTPLLVSTCRAWLAYLEKPVFPGGCFFVAAAAEFDDREGPVREAIRDFYASWRAYLSELVAADPELRGDDVEPDQTVFELLAVMVHLNHCLRLGGGSEAGGRARYSLSSILGRRI